MRNDLKFRGVALLLVFFFATVVVSTIWHNYLMQRDTDARHASLSLSSITSSQEVTDFSVTNPTSSNVWVSGTTCTITWLYIGPVSEPFNIALYNLDGSLYKGIVLDLTDHGYNRDSGASYAWTIPSDVATGSYIIAVEDTESGEYAESGVFSIINWILVLGIVIGSIAVVIVVIVMIKRKKVRSKNPGDFKLITDDSGAQRFVEQSGDKRRKIFRRSTRS